jgi:hypothetical protein
MGELVHFIAEPEVATRPEDLVIVSNEIIESKDDYLSVKAQSLANRIGARVLAYERPYSGAQLSYNKDARDELVESLDSVSRNTAWQLRNISDGMGAESIDIIGHSAAGTDAVHVASTGVLDVRRLFATDPVGVRVTTPVWGEFVEYGGYSLITEQQRDMSERLWTPNIPLESPLSVAESTKRVTQELMTYSRLWRGVDVRDNLINLAADPNSPQTLVIFPEYTFNAKTETLRVVSVIVNSISGVMESPVETRLELGAYHSDFANHEHFANQYNEFYEATKD